MYLFFFVLLYVIMGYLFFLISFIILTILFCIVFVLLSNSGGVFLFGEV